MIILIKMILLIWFCFVLLDRRDQKPERDSEYETFRRVEAYHTNEYIKYWI